MEQVVARAQFTAALHSGDARTVAAFLAQCARVDIDADDRVACADFRARLAWRSESPLAHHQAPVGSVAHAVASGFHDVVAWLFSPDAIALLGPKPLRMGLWVACERALDLSALEMLETALASAAFKDVLSPNDQQYLLDRLLRTISAHNPVAAVPLLIAHGASPLYSPRLRAGLQTFVLSPSAMTPDFALLDAMVREGASPLGARVFDSMVTHPEATMRVLRAMEARGLAAKSFRNLHVAAASGNVDATKLWMELGLVDVDERDWRGQTPLMKVAWPPSRANPFAVAKLLLDYGACVSAQDTDGYTPLRHAINSKYPEIVRLLLEHGADPNQEIHEDEVVLDCLDLRRIHEDRIFAQLQALLTYGADPLAVDASGNSALTRLQATPAGQLFIQLYPHWFSPGSRVPSKADMADE